MLTFQIAGYQPLQRSLPRQIDVTYSMPNANALQIGVAGTPPGHCQRMQQDLRDGARMLLSVLA